MFLLFYEKKIFLGRHQSLRDQSPHLPQARWAFEVKRKKEPPTSW